VSYQRSLHGVALPHAKLNDTLVARLRAEHEIKESMKRHLDATFGAEAQAKRYGVSVNTIHKAITYATWRHVK
jgi:hypothetical protein